MSRPPRRWAEVRLKSRDCSLSLFIAQSQTDVKCSVTQESNDFPAIVMQVAQNGRNSEIDLRLFIP